ncbi:two-CW domain-containing protein [Oceanidesulfovibrio indonesiensis]
MNQAAEDVLEMTGKSSDLERLIQTIIGAEDEYDGEKIPCWEFKKCGREKGGAKESEMGVCPAWPNDGHNCASVSGTFCGGVVQEEQAKKIANCSKCDFFISPHYERKQTHSGAGAALQAMSR